MQIYRGGGEGWNRIVGALPQPHLLQSWQWGEVKHHFRWTPLPLVWEEGGQPCAAALVLEREQRLPPLGLGLRVLYVPRGPLLDWADTGLRSRVLADLATLARERRALLIKIDPEVVVGYGVPGSEEAEEVPLGAEVEADLRRQGWRFSREQVQFRNTVLLDLTPPLETLLAQMKQKTRYNVRLAQRKGVSVRRGGEADIALLQEMYAETAARDGFVIREPRYYEVLWSRMFAAGYAEPLIAEVEGEAVAALVWFRFGERAWYMQGMSRARHREKMPNYLLQWEAICRAKACGCRIYDLWGAPNSFDPGDPLWGVYRFKEGLGGKVVRTSGAWDYTPQPWLYQFYTNLLPRWLAVMRWRGMQRLRQQFS